MEACKQSAMNKVCYNCNNDEPVICEEETEHDESYCMLVNIREVPLFFKTCESDCSDAFESTELVVNTVGSVQLSKIDASSHQTPNIKSFLCINIQSCDDDNHKIVSPCECTGFMLALNTHRERINANHQFLQDEKNLVTNSLCSYFLPVPSTNLFCRKLHHSPSFLNENMCMCNCINENRYKLCLDPCVKAEDNKIELSHSEKETYCLDHDIKKYLLESTEGSEDDSNCDDIECNAYCYEECYGVEECQFFCSSSNELVVHSTAEETVKPRSSNSDKESEGLLIDSYTISEADGSNQVAVSLIGQVLYFLSLIGQVLCYLSLIGQVLCFHTCSDAAKLICGGHVNKPKVNDNQPEDNANRSNVDRQAVSLATSYLPRTEQRRHQLITSANYTQVERDETLRDVTPEGWRITAKEAKTTVRLHIIREKPTQLQQIPTVNPQNTILYDTKFGDNPSLPYEKVKPQAKARTTFVQHEVEDRSQQALNQSTVQNDHPLIVQITDQIAASNTTSSKPKALPKRSCIVVGNTQYPLTTNLLTHPHMDRFFVKERNEIKPSHFLAKLVM